MCKPTNEKRLTNKNGVTFGQLKEFINSIDFVPNDSIVYIDGGNYSEEKVKDAIADEEGLTLYDFS